MRIFLVVCLILAFSTPLLATDTIQSSTLSENWVSKTSPEKPSTDEEQIAVTAASERRDIIRDNMIAKYDGMSNGYSTVTVTTLPEPDSEVQTISRYRILNNFIYANTPPAYGASESQKKKIDAAKQMAYQLAVRANGVNSERPVMSGDKMLAVTFDGKCYATVTEKDFDHMIVAVHRFKLCD